MTRMSKKKAGARGPKAGARNPNAGKSIVTDLNVRVLRELMTGRYLKGAISDEKGEQLQKVLGVGPGATSITLRKLEDMGIVVGYIPLLSEEGKRIIDALELMYGLRKGNHEALVDMVEAH